MSNIDPEPKPRTNDHTPLWHMVIEDMKERDLFGVKKYGTPLQAFNGRDALKDAYQESLDMTVYLRQMVEEYDKMINVVNAAIHFVDAVQLGNTRLENELAEAVHNLEKELL